MADASALRCTLRPQPWAVTTSLPAAVLAFPRNGSTDQGGLQQLERSSECPASGYVSPLERRRWETAASGASQARRPTSATGCPKGKRAALGLPRWAGWLADRHLRRLPHDCRCFTGPLSRLQGDALCSGTCHPPPVPPSCALPLPVACAGALPPWTPAIRILALKHFCRKPQNSSTSVRTARLCLRRWMRMAGYAVSWESWWPCPPQRHAQTHGRVPFARRLLCARSK